MKDALNNPVTREKMSISHTGKKLSKSTREKIGNALRGKHRPKEVKDKISVANGGKNNGMWKGNNAKYFAIHMWVRKHFKKSSACENCGTTNKKLEWSNKDHKYSRKREDWQCFCRSCHYKFDNNKLRSIL